jgi:hypothetical protein
MQLRESVLCTHMRASCQSGTATGGTTGEHADAAAQQLIVAPASSGCSTCAALLTLGWLGLVNSLVKPDRVVKVDRHHDPP